MEYVGGTVQPLSSKLSSHRREATKQQQSQRKLYRHLNLIGFENVKIVLIENHICYSKDELNARVRYWVEQLNPELNRGDYNPAVYPVYLNGYAIVDEE
jgi:hypothetical protein